MYSSKFGLEAGRSTRSKKYSGYYHATTVKQSTRDAAHKLGITNTEIIDLDPYP